MLQGFLCKLWRSGQRLLGHNHTHVADSPAVQLSQVQGHGSPGHWKGDICHVSHWPHRIFGWQAMLHIRCIIYVYVYNIRDIIIYFYMYVHHYIYIYIRTYVYLKYVKIIYCMRWYWYILFQYIDSSKIYHQYCPLSSAILLWNITMMICQGTIGCTPNSVPMVLIGLI